MKKVSEGGTLVCNPSLAHAENSSVHSSANTSTLLEPAAMTGEALRNQVATSGSPKGVVIERSRGVKMSYSGWSLDYPASTATMDRGGAPIVIKLQDTSVGALYEGWWPSKPIKDPSFVLGGCCLWDGRWQIQFAKRASKSKPARRRLSNARDREDAFERLRKGHLAERIYVPRGLGPYHRTLIEWQAAHIRRLSNARVLYHIPTDEYHVYIKLVETHLGRAVPELHSMLDEFAQEMRKELKIAIGSHPVDLRFVHPMRQWNAANPLESYMEPYLRINELCADVSVAMGLEDLGENRLARAAAAITGITVPVLGAVLSIPDTFQDKALRDGDFAVITL